MPFAEIVEYDDGVPSRVQLRGDDAADVSSATCDKNSHLLSFLREHMLHFTGTLSWTRNEDLRVNAGLLLISFGNKLPKIVSSAGRHKIHRGTAEAAACHPRANDARRFFSDSDHDVEFRAAHFVVVS